MFFLIFILKSTNELIMMPLIEFNVISPWDAVLNIHVENRGTSQSPWTGAGLGLVLFIGPSNRMWLFLWQGCNPETRVCSHQEPKLSQKQKWPALLWFSCLWESTARENKQVSGLLVHKCCPEPEARQREQDPVCMCVEAGVGGTPTDTSHLSFVKIAVTHHFVFPVIHTGSPF